MGGIERGLNPFVTLALTSGALVEFGFSKKNRNLGTKSTGMTHTGAVTTDVETLQEQGPGHYKKGNYRREISASHRLCYCGNVGP